MIAWWARRRGTGRAVDGGFTIIELLVTMILMGVVSSLVVAAVAQSSKILTHTDDEEKGLQDAKVILDRLGRDVREARAAECDGLAADLSTPFVLDTSCVAHLQLWVDANSDYLRQSSEVVTWRLQRSSDGIHYDVWRIVGLGAGAVSQRQASSLIMNIAFTYIKADGSTGTAATAQRIDLSMKYDAIFGAGSSVRWVAFTARLRNKG